MAHSADQFSLRLDSKNAQSPPQEKPAWEPFFMPNMDPLARQQGLLFEQSELLREQFLRFGEGLQRLHSMVERLREDLDLEAQQRLRSEDQTSAAVAAVRSDFNGERRKQELLLKQVDERVLALREEVALRARSCDGELQRLSGRADSLAAEIGAQLAGLVEKQRASGEELQAELRGALGEERASLQASMAGLRSELFASLENVTSKSELQAEVQERQEVLRKLESRFDEECLGALRTESAHRQASEEASRTEHGSLRESLEASVATLARGLESLRLNVETETQQRGAAFEATNRRIAENHEHCCVALRNAESQRLQGEETLRASALESGAFHASSVSTAEAALAQKIAGLEAESACEAERWSSQVASLNIAQAKLSNEVDMERQTRSVNTVGLLTEVSELRCEMAREVSSHQEIAASLGHYARQTASLQESVQEEEAAHAAFSGRTEQLRHRTEELQASFETAMSDGWRNVQDNAKMGREELWHVLGALQERTEVTSEEVQDVWMRTKRIEEDCLGEFSGRLEEVAALNGDVSSKVEKLEICSLREQVSFVSRLDDCAHDLERTKQLVDTLVESSSRDFLESRNAQFRLYLTADGDFAVYQRTDWSKWTGSDFQGVPCWHAGCQPIADRPLCSVNREMQAHEKDRFLALANRADLFQ